MEGTQFAAPPGEIVPRCDLANAINPAVQMIGGNVLGLGRPVAIVMLLIIAIAVIATARSRKVAGWLKAIIYVVGGLLVLAIAPAAITALAPGAC